MSYCSFHKLNLPTGCVAKLILRPPAHYYSCLVLLTPPGMIPSDDLLLPASDIRLLTLGNELAWSDGMYRRTTRAWISTKRPVCFLFSTLGDALAAHKVLSREVVQ